MSADSFNADDLQPRTPRKRKRDSTERGLPPDAELRKLAEAYIDVQSKLWPKLVANGIVPAKSDAVLDDMVAVHRQRHVTGELDIDTIRLKLKGLLKLIAAAYCRYSCDNSSPTSILDQMVKCLQKAKKENRFIPWEFIFADYAISGLDSSRRGYVSCKSILDREQPVVDTVFIDDFTRASRDALEWWKLAALCKRKRVRFVGASDGFDLGSEQSEVWITIYGLLSRLFIKGTQQKVLRGMLGAADRGTVVGKLPMGFAKQLVRDEHGIVVYRKNGKPLHKPAIDPDSKRYVIRVFKLFLRRRLSAYKITKRFNQLRVDNTDTWSESTIKNMLANPAYIGIFVWNRYRREFNSETGTWERKKNPRSEWVIYRDPKLAIIPRRWRREALARLRSLKQSDGKKPRLTRNQVSASTLFSGTLVCECCGRELLLYRSAGKYKSMFCMNGRTNVYNCSLTTSKSTAIIEGCLLRFLRDSILTEQAIGELVEQANQHLKSLANRPILNAGPIRSQIASVQKKIDYLHQRIEVLTESEHEICEGYERRIKQHHKEMNELKTELKTIDQANTPVPPLLSKEAICSYLPELHAILNQEIPVAAEAVRQLTGPISIRQERIPGKSRGARWIATFSPKLLEFMRQFAQGKNYPDSITLEFLSRGIWITAPQVAVPIETVPQFEELAPVFKEMHDTGTSIQEIASRHKVSWRVALEIVHFAATGIRPTWHMSDTPQRYAGWDRFAEIAPLVGQLRDVDHLQWTEIVLEVVRRVGFDISGITALRAYEYAHRREVREMLGIGTDFCARAGQNKLDEFKRLFGTGITNGAELARLVGISRRTSSRWKKRLQD